MYFVLGACIFGSRSYLSYFHPFDLLSLLSLDFSCLMPPKTKKQAESASATEDSETPLSSVESAASSCTVTSEHLERILEANHRSMAALIAALPSPTAPSLPPPRIAQIKTPKWSDEETPFEYFTKYKKAMRHNGIDRSTWGQLLPVYLSGRAQASFAQVDDDTLDDYDAVKATMLGDTPASADRRWWTLSRQTGEEAGAFYLRVRSTGTRRFHWLATKEEVCERVILSRFLSLLSPECYNSVVAKQPKNGLEASRYVQEFEETRSFSKRHQSWRSNSNHHGPSSYVKREQGNGGGVGGNGSSSNSSSTSSIAQNSSTSSQAGGGKGAKPEKQNQSNRKPVTCYGCGEIGHIRPKQSEEDYPSGGCFRNVYQWVFGWCRSEGSKG